MPLRIRKRQAARHNLHRLRIVVDENTTPSKSNGGVSEGPASRKEIEQSITLVAVYTDDSIYDRQWLLSWIASFLFAVWAYDRVPPNVRWRLSAGSFLGPDEAWSHVWDTIDVIKTVSVVFWVFSIPENGVVLRRPALCRTRSIVVRPDDFVEETFPAENRVNQHFAVVYFAIVDVEKKKIP